MSHKESNLYDILDNNYFWITRFCFRLIILSSAGSILFHSKNIFQ